MNRKKKRKNRSLNEVKKEKKENYLKCKIKDF